MNYRRDESWMGRDKFGRKPRVTIHSIVNRLFTKSVRVEARLSALPREEFSDISFYQGAIDWVKMRLKARKVIIRAGQNLWVDIRFITNYLLARQVGMSRGVYWFFDGRASPGAQAALLVSLIENDKPELGVWIDWERNYNGAHEGLRNVVVMMQEVERLLPGVEVGMYTGYYFFIENSNAIVHRTQYAYLAKKKLWLAFYSLLEKVLIPKIWPSMTYWQKGTPTWGDEWGVETREIDINEDMTSETPEPEPEEPMETIKEGTVSALKLGGTPHLNIRDGAGGSGFFNDIGNLYPRDRVYGNIVSALWLEFNKIIRANGVIEMFHGFASTQYMDVRDVPVDPPTPGPVERTITGAMVRFSDGTTQELIVKP